MYATVWFGAGCPGLAWDGGAVGGAVRSINEALAAWPVWGWTLVLFAYCHVASVLPVWALLQPRDYINALQLLSGLGIVVAGLVVTAMFGSNGRTLAIVAPAIATHPTGAPSIWPFLFVTVACGAVSGFHCLVSSGTTSKQLRSETDATFVAYGGMLTEGFLAVLVLISVAAGIGLGWSERFGELTGTPLWNTIYRDWASADAGLGTKVGAFVVGAANLVEGLGVPHVLATALLGVLVASFAGTTLDTSTRLQRYVVQELAGRAGIGWLSRPHGATLFAVETAWLLAMIPMPGKPWTAQWIGTGGLALWPLFGAVNQLLGGLAFLVVSFWLRSRALPWKFALAPTAFMLVMPAWALVLQTAVWWNEGSRVLAVTALAVLGLEAWMIREGLTMWMRAEDRFQARSRIRAFPDTD
jgi:carbon starvation protein